MPGPKNRSYEFIPGGRVDWGKLENSVAEDGCGRLQRVAAICLGSTYDKGHISFDRGVLGRCHLEEIERIAIGPMNILYNENSIRARGKLAEITK